MTTTIEQQARELCEALGFPYPSISGERITAALTAARNQALSEMHDKIVSEIIDEKRHTKDERNGARMACAVIRNALKTEVGE